MSIFSIFSACLLAIILFWAIYNAGILFAGIRRKFKTVSASGELPKFSLIVPAKDEGLVIGRCLDSLLKIDYPKDKVEIVIVDGNSKDSTRTICGEFSVRCAGTLKVISEESARGKPGALNLALPHLSGDIVGVFDADSVPEADVLRKMAAYFQDDSVAAVQGRVVSLNEDQNMLTKVSAMEDRAWFQALLAGREKLDLFIPLTGSCQFVRRNALNKLGGWNEASLAEDVELSLELADKGFVVRYAPDVCSGQETASRFGDLVAQRSRWYRGYMEAAFKYGKLLEHHSRKAMDAEVSLFGPFFMLVCLLSYVNWGLSIFLAPDNSIFPVSATFVAALSGLTIFSIGLGMVFTNKPVKLRNALWVPFIFAYWFLQMLIAGWAFLKILSRRRRVWGKTNKRGVMTNGHTLGANST